jgi:hypothetical protein
MATLDYGPMFHRFRVQSSTFSDVHREHLRQLARHTAANPGVTPRLLRTAEDVRESQQRQTRVRGEYRQGMKAGFTEAELNRASSGKYPDTAKELARELEDSPSERP